MNIVVFSGFLGSDPESKDLPSGDSVIEFSLAVRVGRDSTLWVRCSDFSARRAEKVYPHFAKGRGVEISGRIREVRAYTTNEGEARASLEMVVLGVDFPPVRKDERGQASSDSSPAARPRRRALEDDEGDIPF